MDRRGAGWHFAYLEHDHHLSPNTDLKLDYRPQILRALADLPASSNAMDPRGHLTEAPANVLGAHALMRAWEVACNGPYEGPWL